jgi:hypothetical protein
MKNIKACQRSCATLILSQDKLKLVEAPLTKRAGKLAIYYDFDAVSEGSDGLTGFRHSIERRVEKGEVVHLSFDAECGHLTGQIVGHLSQLL